MTLAMIMLVVVALAVFGYVLEPVWRSWLPRHDMEPIEQPEAESSGTPD